METSSDLMIQIQDFVPKGSKLSLGALVEKYSASASWQHDPAQPYYYWLENFSMLRKPEGALSVILALSMVKTGWSSAETTEDLLEHISKICKKNMYQGGWEKVAMVLQQDLYTRGIHGILKRIIADMSSEEVFGNLLPKVYQVIPLIITKQYRTPRVLEGRERFRGVKRKLRRRGYQDKGTRRPSHQWLPGSDWTLLEKEAEFVLKFEQYFHPKNPPAQYYFESLRGRILNSQILKEGESYGKNSREDSSKFNSSG